jgi:glucuronyl esterase-like protein
MKNTARFSLASLSLLGSLATIACGDSGGSDSPTSFTPAAPTTTETPAPPATESNPNPEPPPATDGVPTGNGTDGVVDPTGGVTGAPTTPAAEGSSDGVTEPPPVEPPPVVTTGYPENTGSECAVTAAELGQNGTLPDPFAMHDGTRITTKAQWECRRNEIKKDIERFEIGTKPEPPTVDASLANGQLNVVVTTAAGSITLSSPVTDQTGGSGAGCVAIGMNGNSSLINGCVQVPFLHDQVVGYNQNGQINLDDPFYTVYPELRGQVANYAAWSWGISRIIDGLDQVKEELNIDMSRIGVHGCSYAGKMALFGGAFDERVALTIAQESGGGGINSWRLSQAFVDRTGTQIEKIDNTNYSWFLQSMQRLAPNTLPHDHHELIAMIAPRAVVALGNRDYEWLGDESGYKSALAAKEVWSALGVEASIGLDFTTGHQHCTAAQSQVNTSNTFVNKFLKGQDVDTNINVAPPPNGFELDYTQDIDWQAPALQ